MKNVIQLVINRIRSHFENDFSGHDWHYILRVYRNALYIQSQEGGDREIVALGALLHDISDYKMNGGQLDKGGEEARRILLEVGASPETAEKVAQLVDNISYKGARVADAVISLEQQIVRDADRLDAIGAIGIARAFAYGGNRNRPIYEPEMNAVMHDSFEQYANSKSHTINHFYEKLLLLKDRMHTATGRQMAEERHAVMEDFLAQFYKEWNSEEPEQE